MDNSDGIFYIRLIGFDEESNIAVNRAIKISEKDSCENVNMIHLFIALLGKSRLASKFMHNLGVGDGVFLEKYSEMVDNKEFGEFDSSEVEFSIDYFSGDLYNLCKKASYIAETQHEYVDNDMLFRLIVEGMEEYPEIEDFFERTKLSKEDIMDAIESSFEFEVPRPISLFVTDLNDSETVLNKKISHVDNYTDECFEILSRKRKANPCLIGQAGVGKTSIVEAMVQKIVAGDVPEQFKKTHICAINGATLTAGTKFRGDFEARMKFIMDWAADPNVDVILFIDEIHTFINSGKTGEDSADTAGNMIKSYLSSGEIKVIGATTPAEYSKFIEKDKAFDRRLQSVEVKEPTVEQTIDMIENTIGEYEEYHKVQIPMDIVKEAVVLTDTYMKNKCLPDKAYTILDQVGARAKIAHCKKVSQEMLYSIMSKNTGLNLNQLKKNESKDLLNLEKSIHKSLVGQDKAVEVVAKAIRRSKAGIKDANKPIASFLFVGPTGVGKTELCKILRKELNMGKEAFIRIDMSEYSEKYSTSKLIGTAPGYVGYNEGGQLTEKVKHNPYSIVLLDEIEKAHPDIFNTFLQLLDEGRLTDGSGNTVDFTNCIIVMTSNAGYGADQMQRKVVGFGNEYTKDNIDKEKIALKALESTFRPEFLNRIDNIVIFEKLNEEQCKQIVKLLLSQLSDRIKQNRDIDVRFANTIVTKLMEEGFNDKYGARNLKRQIQKSVEDKLSELILEGKMTKGNKYSVSYSKSGNISVKKV